MKADQLNQIESEWLPPFTPATNLIHESRTKPETAHQNGKSYYNVPLLKKPKWRWQIALYFFCEGISAGSFLLAALGSLFGRKHNRELVRAGYYTSVLALIPCPPLLIADLGRPERFHHMLRVFKPSSPMNLGAWTLLGYSLPATSLAARQLISDGSESKLITALIERPLTAVGLPLALTMTSYPGVLLSTTSTPVWSKSRFLGAVMATSSIKNAVAACSLHLELHGGSEAAKRKLRSLETLASVGEAVALTAYVATAKEAAKPLTKGRYKWHFWIGAITAGLVVPAVLHKRKPTNGKGKTTSIVSAILSLGGGLALKWALTHAGRESAVDVETTHKVTQPTLNSPGWTANTAGPIQISD